MQDQLETVNFSILGQNFSLSCPRTQKDHLLVAIEEVKAKAAKLLRENPTLTPMHTAILTAVDSQNTLQSFLHTSTPFQIQANSTLNKLDKKLASALNQV